MSLYNMLHGFDPNAAAILAALGLDPEDIDRFRDASVASFGGRPVFHIFCRTGGGNRESYPNTALTSSPHYITDRDDEYDCTYAHYFFTIPQAALDQMTRDGVNVETLVDNTSLREKTDAAIAAFSAPEPKP